MKINLLVTGTLLCTSTSYAQNMFSMASQHPADTVRSEAQQQALRFPSLRQASVTADIFGSGKFDAKLNGKDFSNGKSRNARISSYFTIPLSSFNGNVIGATIYHTETFFDIREASNQLPDPQVSTGNISKSTLGLSVNYSRRDVIFHTPVIYSAVFTGISGNLTSIKRFNFNGGIAFPLKHTADSYFSLGALILIDPSAPLPVLPLINYYQKLSSSGLQLIVDLPQGAMLKQSLSQKAAVYLGSNYNTYVSFFKSNNPVLPARFSYNTIEFKSGTGFEYLLGKYVVLGISGGINTFTSARAFAKGESYNDDFLRSSNKSVAYGEFRISLLPF